MPIRRANLRDGGVDPNSSLLISSTRLVDPAVAKLGLFAGTLSSGHAVEFSFNSGELDVLTTGFTVETFLEGMSIAFAKGEVKGSE